MTSFVAAAAASEYDVMWDHLSARTRATMTRAEFRSAAPELAEDVGKVDGGDVFLQEEVGDGQVLVAMVGGPAPGAHAEVLRREGDDWKVELRSLDVIYGVSATQPSEGKLDFQVNAPNPAAVTGSLWLDGERTPVKRRVAGRLVSFVARARAPRSGRRTVVAFARAGERQGAIAWTVGNG
jgi:hypothetical protein